MIFSLSTESCVNSHWWYFSRRMFAYNWSSRPLYFHSMVPCSRPRASVDATLWRQWTARSARAEFYLSRAVRARQANARLRPPVDATNRDVIGPPVERAASAVRNGISDSEVSHRRGARKKFVGSCLFILITQMKLNHMVSLRSSMRKLPN